MARFKDIAASVEGNAIQVKFELDEPGVVGWQIYDPSTGAFLFEGEWTEVRGTKVAMRVAIPEEDGPYRVQVAPVEDRERFILIDASLAEGRISMEEPRVTTAAAVRRARMATAVPKAFVYPPRSLWRNRKLIGSMVRRDILARYRGSFGGALWTLLNPLLLMAVYAFVFGVVLKTRFSADTSGMGYVLYFLAGMMPWLAFSEAVGRSTYVIAEHRNFVKKLVFPLDTLPANLVIAGAVTELFALGVFICGLLIARHSVPVTVLWLPALIIPQLLFTVGLCWFLSALGIFVRDLSQIMGLILTLWFFLTPICYEARAVNLPPAVGRLLEINPIYILVRGYRAIFLDRHAPDLTELGIFWAVSAALAVLGYAWFHRLQRSFADVI